MKQIDFHHATDRRCYYGAASSDLQKELDCRDSARTELEKHGYRATYFPAGGFYVGFKHVPDSAPIIITEDMPSFESCYRAIVEYHKTLTPSHAWRAE